MVGFGRGHETSGGRDTQNKLIRSEEGLTLLLRRLISHIPNDPGQLRRLVEAPCLFKARIRCPLTKEQCLR